jgi:hypothetical protein
MPQIANELWSLALDRMAIDPAELVEAVEDQVRRGDLDFRSRLLIRDSLLALEQTWGKDRLRQWLNNSPQAKGLLAILGEDLGETGFPSLQRRIMETTRPDTIQQLFRELGRRLRLRKPLRVYVGGSCALILKDLLSRRTEDIDIVDELPPEIRSEHQLLSDLDQRYNLHLGHFQSHYLPSGWQNRAHYLDDFDDLTVYLVDVYDIFLSKLFSVRTKDLDDLRMLLPQLDKATLVDRFKHTTGSITAAEEYRKRAEHNWYILFGEALPQ